MADMPIEGGPAKAPAPRRARKPRTAPAAKGATTKSAPAKTKAVAPAVPAKTAPSAKPAAANRTTKAAAPKAAAKPASRAPRRTSAAKPSAAAAKAPSPAARVAKSVQQGVAAVAPTGRKKFAIVAALAGVAAGIATVFGRRKINKAATEAIDAVSGTDSSTPAAAETSTTD